VYAGVWWKLMNHGKSFLTLQVSRPAFGRRAISTTDHPGAAIFRKPCGIFERLGYNPLKKGHQLNHTLC